MNAPQEHQILIDDGALEAARARVPVRDMLAHGGHKARRRERDDDAEEPARIRNVEVNSDPCARGSALAEALRQRLRVANGRMPRRVRRGRLLAPPAVHPSPKVRDGSLRCRRVLQTVLYVRVRM